MTEPAALIDTPRLRLRPFRASDFAAIAPLLGDDAFMAWSVPGPLHGDAARARLAKLIECYAANGFSKLAIFPKDADTLIGYCGLDTELIDGRRVVELGFRIARGQRGRGYAFEAAGAVLVDGFTRLDLASIVAFAEPGNTPSLKLLEKLGMALEREVALKGRRYLLHRSDNPGRQA